MKENRIEIVKWIDSEGEDGWHFADDEPEIKPCLSVGWITCETEQLIIITSHIHGKQHHADMLIPKCAIIERDIVNQEAIDES